MTGLPVLTVVPDREALARYGLPLAAVQDVVSTAMGGRVASQFYEGDRLYEGDRRFDIIVRLDDERRGRTDELLELPVRIGEDSFVPLGELASVELLNGNNQVNRENGKLRIVVTANVRGRDLGGFVQEARDAIESQVDIPPGYWVSYGGTYENLLSASKRLSIVVPVTLLLIIGLLYMALNSVRDALIIFSGVPLALTGGIAALLLREIPFFYFRSGRVHRAFRDRGTERTGDGHVLPRSDRARQEHAGSHNRRRSRQDAP